MESQVIKTKLTIPLNREGIVKRPRLLKKLNSGTSKKLTVISAPPGSGKTTVLSQWVQSMNTKVAWISLDKGDNDPALFCSYIIYAIHSVKKNIGDAALGMLRSFHTSPMEAIFTTLLNDLAGDGTPLLFVLDDYHEIVNEKIHEGLSFFIQHSPQKFHLVISSRASVPISVGRMRLQGNLNELGEEDLRFNTKETHQFFNRVMQLKLDSGCIKTLEKKAEGWIAGLQMAALSLPGHQDISEFISSFRGDHIHLSDFFIEEVISKQPEHIQSFLFRTAILDRLCGSLCEDLTGMDNSSQILSEIYNANLFIIPLDNKGRWYRYHHLFAQLLKDKLEKSWPDTIGGLHLKASKWFERYNFSDEAIHHALKGDDIERATELMEKFGVDCLYHGKRATVYRWLKMLPEETIKNNIIFNIAHAWIIYPEKTSAAYKKVQERLKDAERILSQKGCKEAATKYFTNQQLFSFIVALKALLAREKKAPPEKIIDLIEKALESLSKENSTLKSILLLNLGLTHIITGDFDKGKRLIEDVDLIVQDDPNNYYVMACSAYFRAWVEWLHGKIRTASEICRSVLSSSQGINQSHVPVVDCLKTFLSTIYIEQNHLDKAEEILEKGIASMRLVKEWGFLLNGYASLIRLKMARKDDIKTIRALVDEISVMEKYRSSSQLLAAALNIRLFLIYKDTLPDAVRRAEDYAIDQRIHLEVFPAHEDHFQLEEWHLSAQFSLVRLIIERHRSGRPSRLSWDIKDALAYLNDCLKQQKQKGLNKRVIEIHILKSMVYDASGKPDEALKSIETSLSLAQEEDFVRVFIEEGRRMEKLLERAATNGRHPDKTGRLLNAFRNEKLNNPPPDLSADSHLVESLSKRELEVLRLIAAGFSNNEIAKRLFVSEGTIKKHNYNIFGKLDVKNRTRAIARAKMIGLL